MSPNNRRRIGTSSRSANKKWLGRNLLIVLSLLFLLAAGVTGFILFETEKPQVTLSKDLQFLGSPLEIQVQATDQRSGIQQVAITLQQNGQELQLFKKDFPRQAWLSKAGPGEIQETLTLDVQKAGGKEGDAKLTVSVHDFSLNGALQGNETVLVFPIRIDTKPPRVHIEHSQQYMLH